MTLHEINALIFLILVALAGGFAIPGWLTGREDGVERFACRFTAWALLFGAFIAQSANQARWSASWWFTMVLGLCAINKCTHWWRKLEAARELRRRIAAYNRGEIYRGKR